MTTRRARSGGTALMLVLATMAPIVAGASSASAATVTKGSTSSLPAGAPTASWSPVPPLAPAAPGGRSAANAPQAKGENPPGRVTQSPGLAGYEVPTGSTVSVSAEVTVPAMTCHTATNPSFGDVDTSDPASEVAIGFDSTLQVATTLLYNCAAGDYVGVSTIETICTRKFGLGTCYYEGFLGGSVGPGDVVRLTATLSPTATTSTITDLTSGAHLTFSYGGVSVSSTSTLVGAKDFCFLLGGDSEPCSLDDGGSSTPPPGYASYTPFLFTSVTVDGTGLGAYLAGPNSGGWIEINNVWGATLEGQTTYVGSTDSFTDTNAQLLLPTLSVSSPRVDQPSSKNATLTFDATLSFSSSYPIYLSYATSGGSAKAGSNYTPVSGTLEFPPGTTQESIPVTVLSGAEVKTTTNVLTVDLVFSQPSYVARGATGVGTINEGPIVTRVAPSVLPLNGGPGTEVTVTGYDLGHVVNVKFCPTVVQGGGACLTGSSVDVLNDTTLTVVAPNATTDLRAGNPRLLTDTIATDSQGVSSPVSEPADVETFGCTQQVITDGTWQAAGCMTDETGTRDVTQKESHLDGLGVSASATDDVTYAAATKDVASHGTVSVSLPVTSSTAITIFKGKLQRALKGPVTFSIPAKTKIAGIGISGSITLSPVSLGKAHGSVTATLPAILGGGTGKLTFTTNTGGTLSNVVITVPKATFMQLFSLTTLHVAFQAPGTWQLSATASTGGTTQTKFSGKLVYASNTLKSGTLAVSSISLAGMVTITNLKVTYAAGKWSGSAKVKQAKQSATIAVTFTSSSSTITSASFKTGAVPLFGYIDVKSFALTYNGSKWSLSVVSTLSGGASASASLTVSNGVISKASIKLTKFSLTPAVEIATASLSYAQSAPNAQCPTVTGTEIWCGAWQIQLPQAEAVTGVGGSLAFADGQFQGASVDVTGSVPLLDGVFLTHLGAHLSFHPTVVGGGATISLGPRVSNVSALSVTATLTRTFPTSGKGGKYVVGGKVTALKGSTHSLLLGTATITVPTSGATTFTLVLGGKTGLTLSALGATAKITGTVKGTFTATTFKLFGTTKITVPLFHTVTGTLKADNHGVAACGKVSGYEVGFDYVWSTGSLKVLDTKGCTEKGF